MKLGIKCTVVAFACVFLIAGCANGGEKNESAGHASEAAAATQTGSMIETISTDNNAQAGNANENIKPERVLQMSLENEKAEYVENKAPGSDVSFYIVPYNGEGTLAVLVNRVSLEDNILDLGVSLDTIHDAEVSIGNGAEMQTYGYPDYAFANWETGEMIEGAYIVAVDLTVTNIDASTKHYVNNELLPLGVTPGPENEEKAYVFRADYLNLDDLTRKKAPFQGSFVWFSDHGQREEASGAFYLPPGETTDMTLYYVIGENDGSTLSNLGLTVLPAITFIPKAIYPVAVDENV